MKQLELKDIWNSWNLYEFENRIKTEFKYKYNLKIHLHFKRNDIDRNTGLYDVQCIYYFFSPDNNKLETFKKENILINKEIQSFKDFLFMINEINNEKYKDVKFEDENQNEIDVKNENRITIDSYEEILEKDLFQLDSLPSENIIIGQISIIGAHKKIAEAIIELSKNYFISLGSEDGIKIYNEKFELAEELNENIKGIDNRIYTITEIKKNNNKSDKELSVIGCTNKELYLFNFDFGKKVLKKDNYEIPGVTYVSFIQMKDKNLLFKQQSNVFKHDIIKNKTYRNVIKLSDNIIVLTSNSIIVVGEDKLIFYNITKNKKSSQIQGYSFITSTNGLFLLSREINNKQIKLYSVLAKIFFKPKKWNSFS